MPEIICFDFIFNKFEQNRGGTRLTKKKKLLIGLGVFVALVCIIMVEIAALPLVELESSYARWKGVCYIDGNDPHDTWNVVIAYKGDGKVTGLYEETEYNGDQMKGEEELRKYPNIVLPFWVQFALGERHTKKVFDEVVCFGDDPKVVTIRVKWTENGKTEEAILHN